MADFELSYRITMKYEGGYCNTPGDRGGETWKGIARNFHPAWEGWKIVDTIKAGHPKSLNAALAADHTLDAFVLRFYKKDFWDCLMLDQVRCQQIANQLFDVSVNMGSKTAATFLQQSINRYLDKPLLIDGCVGTKTVAAVNGLKDKDVYDEINVLRTAKYDAIIAANHSQEKFRHSWFSRITPFVETANSNTA